LEKSRNNWNSFEASKFITIEGAREHNLKDISLKIPRNKLVVITGLSGSGKSSLAFDTIYAEGQRRYMESFSAYARQFLGTMKKPDVDKIEGLSPVIAIEQKTTSKSPRSTVGTITEIYDFLRLLFARTSNAYSYETGELMVSYSTDQILNIINQDFNNSKIILLAPLVKGRKGHYRELFEKLGKQGYSKVRIDGEVFNIEKGLQADRYKRHDIEVVIDRLKIESTSEKKRLKNSISTALKIGDGAIMVLNVDNKNLKFYSQHLTCPTTGISYKLPEPNLFSFNSPYGACPKCNGLGETFSFDEKKIVPNKALSIAKGAIFPIGKAKKNFIFGQLEELSKSYSQDLKIPFKDLSEDFKKALILGNIDEINSDHFKFDGILNHLNQLNEFENSNENKWLKSYMASDVCESCHGGRLKRESNHFKISNKSISEVANLDISELKEWLNSIDDSFTTTQKSIATEILKETVKKVDFLLDVGLDYLSLNRTAKTLSGGESQRIRLANQIGSQLVGVLYILDEPSIGLHQRDNQRLIDALIKLRDNGNTIIVVEHDKDIMRKADYIIDIGPKAGEYGGYIIDQGKPNELKNKESTTYRYLSGIDKIEIPERRKVVKSKQIIIKGASGNNLQNVNLNIPIGVFTCISGISGSGKSTLINGTLVPLLYNKIYKSKVSPLPIKSVKGLDLVDKVIEIDQSPIGRTPRSNPATYTGLFGDIRNLYAQLSQSKIMGFKPGRFSFNVVGGRCEECKGAGIETIEMNFLPDVYVTCKTCYGKRYNQETLQINFKGKSINDVLNLPISEAVVFFESHPNIHRKIKALADVGLGYIKLGQGSTTLSGGEAQRIKLATELSKKATGNTIYILDEPTTGLHFEDINVLIGVLQKITDKGNTVIVIEHNLDVIKVADYVIDLGPEGGKKGGLIVAEGTPEEISKNNKSVTGKFLKEEL
jgi:excinuclease ABC subunit A